MWIGGWVQKPDKYSFAINPHNVSLGDLIQLAGGLSTTLKNPKYEAELSHVETNGIVNIRKWVGQNRWDTPLRKLGLNVTEFNMLTIAGYSRDEL
jgi:hypothetical protein